MTTFISFSQCSGSFSPLLAVVACAFPMWEMWKQSFPLLPRDVAWHAYATNNQWNEDQTLVREGVFRLSGVRVQRGELTP